MRCNQPVPSAADGRVGIVALAGPITMNAAVPAEGAAPRALTCYVVEDSAVIRQNLVAALEELLAVRSVGFAEDERSAIEWLQGEHDCQLIIIDVFLKSGTGLEVLRRARAARPQASLVVLTNYATADIRRRCLQLGADRVFDKSAELEELLAYCADLAART